MPATTATYALPYPLNTDAPDGPAQIKALADKLDTTLAGLDRTSWPHGSYSLGSVTGVANATWIVPNPTVRNPGAAGVNLSGGKFSVTQAGLYLITTAVTWASTSLSGSRVTRLQKTPNGTTTSPGTPVTLSFRADPAGFSGALVFDLTATEYLTTTDTITIDTQQTSGGTLNFNGGRLDIVRIA